MPIKIYRRNTVNKQRKKIQGVEIGILLVNFVLTGIIIITMIEMLDLSIWSIIACGKKTSRQSHNHIPNVVLDFNYYFSYNKSELLSYYMSTRIFKNLKLKN